MEKIEPPGRKEREEGSFSLPGGGKEKEFRLMAKGYIPIGDANILSAVYPSDKMVSLRTL
jgi:hypothetical protein